ncbi:hypothetical protein BCR35DRAFT_309449 [Leucosporidium creatinivorum]|uniref:Emopamil-binding protein n=1 Tax=Leucosporidium creatinivorum TaxID=106004 RepID=A0A1Y2DGD3_9BASI|nr:hypothetical protein BCR35DRAFT_309449 [Leucosporidium creatinivorum]
MAGLQQAEHRSPTWIRAWFILSAIVVMWDVGYCLARPHSFQGGKWHWIWWPYSLYERTDVIYSPEYYATGAGFTSAQAYLNIVETGVNLLYVFLAGRKSPVAILAGFIGVLFTFWKTVLYWLQDQQCGWCYTGQNSQRDWWLLFALPNGLWLVIPGLIAIIFGRELAAGLRAGAKAKVL